jgi:polar amino acid transport system substrate-binding protein
MNRWRRDILKAAAITSVLAFASCATAQPVKAVAVKPDAAVLKDLAPQGKVRVAINLGNQVLAQKDATGRIGGVTVFLAQELGKRLGVPIEMTPYDAAGKVFDALEQGAWDVAFLGIEPARAEKIAFSNPYIFIDGTYLVHADSPIKVPEDADKPGVKISVGRGAAYDLFLTRTLKNAELVRAPTSGASIDLFITSKLDASAGVRQALAVAAAKTPGLRVLDGSFQRIEQALAAPRGRDAGARYLNAFIEEMKASGAVRKALDASGQADATVAPAMPVK